MARIRISARQTLLWGTLLTTLGWPVSWYTLWTGSILSKSVLYTCIVFQKHKYIIKVSQWFWWNKNEQLEKKQHPTSTKQSETCQSSQKSVTFGVLFPMFCPLLSIHLESGVESQSCLLWGSVNPATPTCRNYILQGILCWWFTQCGLTPAS